MRAKTINSQSQEASRFAQLKLINSMRDFSYRKSYKLNKNFIKEEIQRCSDQANYVCEAMKQAEKKRKDKKLIRLQQRKKNEMVREENTKLSLQHFMERTRRMQTSASYKNLPHASQIIDNTNLLLQTVQSAANLDAQTREKHRALRQSYKRDIMLVQAQEIRNQQEEKKQKHRLLSLIRWDLIRSYRNNLERTYAEESLQRQVVKKWIVYAKLWRIIWKLKDLYDQKVKEHKQRHIKEEKSKFIQKAFRKLFSNSFGKRGSSIQDRMLYRIIHINHLFAQFIDNQTQNQAKAQLLSFLEARSSRYQLESRIRAVTRSAMILKRNWIQYKFSYVLRQALLKARMEQQIQEWSKKAIEDKKLISKPERSEILNSYARMCENDECKAIAQKNLVLFSKMIKYESMINNFYFRIEKEFVEATKMLRQLNKEEAEEMSHEIHSPHPDSTYEEEESCASSPETETTLQRRRRLRNECVRRLDKVAKFRQSTFLSSMERIYDEIVKEVCKIDMDRANFAVYCWEGMEGHEEIKKRAKQHITLRKKNAQSSKANKLDAYEKNYRKGQAKIVKDAFSQWIKQRREDFFKMLRKSIQTMDFSNWKLKQLVDVPQEAISGAFFMPGRPTQPQELSFMFMKIMDEVYALQEGHREKRSKAGKSKKNKDIEKEKEKE